jgi:hypothetical protein
MGMMNIQASPTTSDRHRTSTPVPVKSNASVPFTFRHSQRIIAFATQAQPTIERIDIPSRRIQPI